ncbi:MAG: hypothetical protein G01um10143_837 [Parcubacteria group bacterium Gr01-1014_3]|nr:MAG: hypothetical protein G01um10143_837 [Parcubacteria group bacterium Gr01-1014_3]
MGEARPRNLGGDSRRPDNAWVHPVIRPDAQSNDWAIPSGPTKRTRNTQK